MTTLPPRQEWAANALATTPLPRANEKGEHCALPKSGAGNESRTRDLNLGKVALYQLSYVRTNTNRVTSRSVLGRH